MSIPAGHTTLWPPSPLLAWAKAALSRRARIPFNLCMGSLQVNGERLAVDPAYAQRVLAGGFDGRDPDTFGLAHTFSFEEFVIAVPRSSHPSQNMLSRESAPPAQIARVSSLASQRGQANCLPG